MGALFLVGTSDPGFAAQALAAARAQFARHGLPEPTALSLPGWRGLHAGHACCGGEMLVADGDDLVAVAGTLCYDGMLGRPALAALLADFDPRAPDWQRLSGEFVALVRKQGRALLFTDYFSAFQLFHDAEERLFSTSFLAAAASLPRLSFDPQGVYEFAFNVFPIGNDSVLNELKRLGPDRLVDLGARGASSRPLAKPLPDAPIDVPLAEHVKLSAARLRATVRPYVAAYRDRIQTPLSGGLDSRLLLAALRAEGSRPRVYVYGSRNHPDVEIAQAIGRAESFAVDYVEKKALRAIEPDGFAEQVARNFHEGDALIPDGALFDNGGNLAARHALHAGGTLAASGGCGEVFRNFFFLRDGPMTAAALVRCFYAPHAPGDVTAAFDEARYLAAIEDKLLAALGRPGDRAPLERTLIEQAYPRVRCRAFFGREISLVGRQGPYLMPFIDHRVVAGALTLPLAHKNAGRAEAMLLAAIDPALARHPSAYGHDFAGPPGLRHRLSEWATRVRPTTLRARSYAIRRRLAPISDEHGGLLGPRWLGRVMDVNFPAMRRYFRPRRITDIGLWRRVATLEYLAQHLGGRLSEDI